MAKQRNKPNQRYAITVPIKGMHCASCEVLIGQELESIPGVTSASASLKTKSAKIVSSRPLSDDKIESAIEAAGYEVGYETSAASLISKDGSVWRDFAVGVAVVSILAFLFVGMSVDSLASGISSGSNGTMALIVGLTAGFSTCMALIGGLVLGLSSKYAEKHPNQSTLQKFQPHLFFNLGRIVSFTVLGALIGAIGSAFVLSGTLLGFLTLVVGIVMLVLGLQLTGIFPRITKGISLPSGIAKRLGLDSKKNRPYSHTNAFLMGAVTFFLPCGFTQAMQLLAVSAGDPLQAAIIMGAFAIGTTPGLLSLGGVTSAVKGDFAKRFFRIVGVVVVAMAFVNLTNGYTLSGIGRAIDSLGKQTSSAKPDESLEGSTVLSTTFKVKPDIIPSEFTAKVGEKTTLLVDVKEEGRGCMSTIMIPGLDDTPQFLKKGKQIRLTFTATEPGEYQITCAMGIPRGSITVKA